MDDEILPRRVVTEEKEINMKLLRFVLVVLSYGIKP
jgi:hypothetical protein